MSGTGAALLANMLASVTWGLLAFSLAQAEPQGEARVEHRPDGSVCVIVSRPGQPDEVSCRVPDVPRAIREPLATGLTPDHAPTRSEQRAAFDQAIAASKRKRLSAYWLVPPASVAVVGTGTVIISGLAIGGDYLAKVLFTQFLCGLFGGCTGGPPPLAPPRPLAQVFTVGLVSAVVGGLLEVVVVALRAPEGRHLEELLRERAALDPAS
jgi:hypothetical protein